MWVDCGDQPAMSGMFRYRENGPSGMPLIRSGSAVEDRQS